jgi:single-strand DNA-binding protein
MSNINFANINIQGRLTGDPEVGTTSKGTTYTKFRVAVNRKISRDDEKTSFIPVIVFGKDAVNCAEYLSKGRTVMVSGEFETDNYEDREGNKRTGFSVVSRNVIFGSGGRSNEDSDSGSSSNGSSNRTKGQGQAEEYLNKGRGRGYDRG